MHVWTSLFFVLRSHAKVEVQNVDGRTPMWFACHGNHLEIAKLLFEKKAKLDTQDDYKVSGLIVAFLAGKSNMVKWVLKNIPTLPSDKELAQFEKKHRDNEHFTSIGQLKEQVNKAMRVRESEAMRNAAKLIEGEKREHQKKAKKAGPKKKKPKAKKSSDKQLFDGTFILLHVPTSWPILC